MRNDMYLTSEAVRFMTKDPHAKAFDAETIGNLNAFKKQIDLATKFIPLWVKVAVAIALGLGTMVGWKRIVVTIGEKIGKTHLTYAQGASAELVAMSTIARGRHVRPAGLDDARAVLGSRRHHGGEPLGPADGARCAICAMAWVLTLPVAILLSGSLYWIFRQIF